ncbi:ATP-binding protein [Ewingella americana]|uniref:DNA-directed DNA polymerase n=1 Tax=Ewingella americana TaxID=41202 RepID=A0A502GER8_9GAMM|nr:AAA family ATPase [Ewingella americana]TPG60028.1 AAA family ATPase [Ewingella americana]
MSWATKHRPSSFGTSQLVGQESARKILFNLMKRYAKSGRDWDKMPSCLILVGSHGSGKTTISRISARHLNCEHGPLTVCGECKSCKAIDAGSFRDLIEIDAASNRGVDQSSQLKQRLDYAIMGHVRVVILDEAHMLTKEAWASWLKTMEEGKKNTLFILATTDENKIPDTIYSRAMTFFIKTVNPEEAAPRLIEVAANEGYTIDQETAQTASFLMHGHMRDSIQLLETASLLLSDEDEANVITTSNLYEAAGLASLEMAQTFTQFFFDRDFDGLVAFLTSCNESPTGLLKAALQYINSGVSDVGSAMNAVPLYEKIALLEELGVAVMEINEHGLSILFLTHYYQRFLRKIGVTGQADA